jgi:hypothetical protein
LGEVTPHGGRSVEQIEADMAARRKRLAATLDELSVRTHPSTLTEKAKEEAGAAVDRTVGRLYARANEAVSQVSARVRKEMFDGYGSPRMDRVVPAAMVVVAVVGLVAVRRRRK